VVTSSEGGAAAGAMGGAAGRATDGAAAGNAVAGSGDRPVRILALELDPANPPLRLGQWLADAGASVEVRRVHAGDAVPGYPAGGAVGVPAGDVPAAGAPGVPASSANDSAAGYDAVLVLGGAYGVYDDDRAPWLAAVRAFVSRVIADATPLLVIGLGAQILAVAAGGRVERAGSGYRLGAALAAKRDITEQDLLLGSVPITPDVMQFHRDSIVALPGGSVLLLASVADPVEAFRVGSTAWGLQFHVEAGAGDVRGWLDDPARGVSDEDRERSAARFGPALDEADEMMAGTWQVVAHRFVDLVREGIPQTPTGRHAPRLPIVASELGG